MQQGSRNTVKATVIEQRNRLQNRRQEQYKDDPAKNTVNIE